jgi:hypothetical protein
VSVPLLAATGRLGVAVALFLAERLGKAVRTPARDTTLAGAGAHVGRGLTDGQVPPPYVVAVAVDALAALAAGRVDDCRVLPTLIRSGVGDG